jgi:hypothetical protein
MIGLAIAIFFLSIGYFLLFNNKNNVDNITSKTGKLEKDSRPEKSISSNAAIPSGKDNKYYVVYIKQKNGGSSFVPKKLNPGFKNDSDFHVSISFDDNGNIINNEKVIEIVDFSISSQNKEEIKKIAGIKNYKSALKEIEDRVLEIKKSTLSLFK